MINYTFSSAGQNTKTHMRKIKQCKRALLGRNVKNSYFPTCVNLGAGSGSGSTSVLDDADPQHCLRVEEKYGQSLGTEARYCFI
jgi:hypothetical protein